MCETAEPHALITAPEVGFYLALRPVSSQIQIFETLE